jgi:hypothetical protein
MGLGSGIRDPGSGINLFQIPDHGPGAKKAPDPGFRIRIRNTASNIRKICCFTVDGFSSWFQPPTVNVAYVHCNCFIHQCTVRPC